MTKKKRTKWCFNTFAHDVYQSCDCRFHIAWYERVDAVLEQRANGDHWRASRVDVGQFNPQAHQWNVRRDDNSIAWLSALDDSRLLSIIILFEKSTWIFKDDYRKVYKRLGQSVLSIHFVQFRGNIFSVVFWGGNIKFFFYRNVIQPVSQSVIRLPACHIAKSVQLSDRVKVSVWPSSVFFTRLVSFQLVYLVLAFFVF